MTLLSLRERLRIPSYDDPGQCFLGVVEIDHDKCNCCGLCVKACIVKALYIEGKGKDRKLRVIPHLQQCCACNDCMAICEQGAIKAVKPSDWLYRYKQVMRGEGMEPPRNFRD